MNNLSVEGWHEFLDTFERDVWPIFAEHGYSKGDALIIYRMNMLMSYVEDVELAVKELHPESDDEEEWRNHE